jgi:hypothetical protein
MSTARDDIQDPTGQRSNIPGIGYTRGYGTGVAYQSGTNSISGIAGNPIQGEAGWAPGALFINPLTTIVGNFLWMNDNTALSATWINIDGPSNTLQGLVATAAEINRNNHVSTRLVTAITTLAVTQALHEGKTILLSLAGGFTSTLPAASGSGNKFRLVVGVVSTTGYVINTADQGGADTDAFQGVINTCSTTETPDLGQPWVTASNSNRITLNGTTKGGVQIGDWIEFEDILAGVYAVRGQTVSSGSEVTPFSHV